MLTRRQRLFAANNGGGNLRRQLLDGAPFLSELLHTAVPTRAAPGTTATFTRATTKTWPNNDGYLVTGVSGEIGFVGARRVRNLLTFTEDFSNAAWTKTGVTATAGQLTEDGTTGVHRTNQPLAGGATFAIGTRLLVQVELKQEGRRYVQLAVSNPPFGATSNAMFDLQSGVVSSTGAGSSATITATSGGYYRCTLLSNAASSAAVSSVFINPSNDGTNVSYTGTNGLVSISVRKAQVEDVTAQTTQTAGEYVSVGAPTDWAGDELVTNGTFDSDTTGWTARNIGSLSVVAGKLRVTNGSFGGAEQVITTVVGVKYVLSRNFTAGTSSTCITQVGTSSGNNDIYAGGNITDQYLAVEFTATSTTTYIQVYLGDGTGGNYADFDNISVKPAYYHGSFVDGVKCFPTDLAGNALTTMLGYNAEGARTNLCLQSNAFTTAPWLTLGAPSFAQNLTGPNGQANYAWTITDAEAGQTSSPYEVIAVSAGATYTWSAKVAKAVSKTSFAAISLRHNVAATLISAAIVDQVNGTVYGIPTSGVFVTPVATSIRSFNDDFWLVSVTGTQAGATLEMYGVVHPAYSTNGTTFDAAAQGSAGFCDTQLELGSFATSYIATTTAAVTRDADVDAYSSAGNIDGTNGWCYFETSADWSANSGGSAIGLGTGSVAIIYMDGVKISFYDGVNADVEGNYVPSVGDKVCVTWGGTTSSIAVNGVVLDTGTFTAFTPDANVFVGSRSTGSVRWFGNIGPIYIGQRQLSASEMQAITA